MTTPDAAAERAIWRRQRKLEIKPYGPTPADYAELARRIDSFARRVKIGAA